MHDGESSQAIARGPAKREQPAFRVDVDADGRPTRELSAARLVQLAIYWYGLVSVMNGVGIVLQERMPSLVPVDVVGVATAAAQAGGVLVAVLVQPTLGTISDYTTSRWGRRKPYILVGTTLDLVLLVAIAASQTFLAVAAFLLLLQLSSNSAQGPFQGYLPDLVPARQVGIASGLVGVMTVLGTLGGILTVTIGHAIFRDYTVPTIALGVVEFATMAILFARLDEGKAPKQRDGRSWRSIAAEAWGTDILRERSFVLLVSSRFFILGGASFLLAFPVRYFERSLAIPDADERGLWITIVTLAVGLATIVATLPAARISDRVGRKPVIWAACAVGAAGMLVLAAAPIPAVAVPGAVLVGLGAGTFLSVDWALMTDLIPKASAGRYMGISNVATATNGLVAGAIGGLLVDAFYSLGDPGAGPRLAFLVAIASYGAGALLLRDVRETRGPRAMAAGIPGTA